MTKLIGDIMQDQKISDQNDELISQLSDTYNAYINNINDLNKQYMKKLIIMVVINIVIVAAVSIYIIAKTT